MGKQSKYQYFLSSLNQEMERFHTDWAVIIMSTLEMICMGRQRENRNNIGRLIFAEAFERPFVDLFAAR